MKIYSNERIDANMDNNINEKVDLSLSNEEFYKRYGRKKIVSLFTLG